jgi:hypothetical protein
MRDRTSAAWSARSTLRLPVATYGEGFSLGPTIGVIVPVNPELSLDFNSGFTWRGRYLSEGDFVPWMLTTFGVQVIDPSKVWTWAVSASWSHHNFSAQGSASSRWKPRTTATACLSTSPVREGRLLAARLTSGTTIGRRALKTLGCTSNRTPFDRRSYRRLFWWGRSSTAIATSIAPA